MRLKARIIGDAAEDVAVDNKIADVDLLYSVGQSFEEDLFDRFSSDNEFKISGKVYTFPIGLFNNEVQENMSWYDSAIDSFGRFQQKNSCYESHKLTTSSSRI